MRLKCNVHLRRYNAPAYRKLFVVVALGDARYSNLSMNACERCCRRSGMLMYSEADVDKMRLRHVPDDPQDLAGVAGAKP